MVTLSVWESFRFKAIRDTVYTDAHNHVITWEMILDVDKKEKKKNSFLAHIRFS